MACRGGLTTKICGALAQIEPIDQVNHVGVWHCCWMVGVHNQDRRNTFSSQSREVKRHVRLDPAGSCVSYE
jgi:hypothetical protein